MNHVSFNPIKDTYTASPPKNTPLPSISPQVAQSIFETLLTPVTSLRKNLAAKILFSTSNSEDWENKRIQIQQNSGAVRVTLTSPNGNILDGMLFAAIPDGSLQSTKAVIFAPGADGYYEDNFSSYLFSLIKKNLGNINILIVNYPSVMASSGDLNLDAMGLTVFTGFSYLTEKQKIHPNDIVIFGQSLGGLASIKGADLIQKEYPDAAIKLISDRSFLSLPDVVEKSYTAISRTLFDTPEWKSDSALEQFRSLKGEKLLIFSKYDGLVLKSVSIYKTLQKLGFLSGINVIKMEGQTVSMNEHFRQYTPKEETAILEGMRRMLGLSPIT